MALGRRLQAPASFSRAATTPSGSRLAPALWRNSRLLKYGPIEFNRINIITLLLAHDLIGKPVPTFPDHALDWHYAPKARVHKYV